MKEKKIIFSLVSLIILFSAINIGYADENVAIFKENNIISSSELNITFNEESEYFDENVIITGPTTVSLKQVILEEVGESKTFSIPIVNNSDNVFVKIDSKVFNTNTEYFKVTCDISKSVLKPESDEAIAKITVQLEKMPLYSTENTEFEIEIIAENI